jgi:hypothetical protein
MFRSRRGRRSARPSQRSVKPGRPTVAFAPQYRTSRRDLSRLHALDQKVVGPTEARFRKCPIGPRLGAQDDFSPGFWLRAVGAGCSDVRLGSLADLRSLPASRHSERLLRGESGRWISPAPDARLISRPISYLVGLLWVGSGL